MEALAVKPPVGATSRWIHTDRPNCHYKVVATGRPGMASTL